MGKSLEQLKKENERLLRKRNARQSLMNLSLKRKLERKRLVAENKALRNPLSTSARKAASKVAVKTSVAFFKGAIAVGKHLSAVAAEQNMQKPRRKAPKKKKTVRKRKKR